MGVIPFLSLLQQTGEATEETTILEMETQEGPEAVELEGIHLLLVPEVEEIKETAVEMVLRLLILRQVVVVVQEEPEEALERETTILEMEEVEPQIA